MAGGPPGGDINDLFQMWDFLTIPPPFPLLKWLFRQHIKYFFLLPSLVNILRAEVFMMMLPEPLITDQLPHGPS